MWPVSRGGQSSSGGSSGDLPELFRIITVSACGPEGGGAEVVAYEDFPLLSASLHTAAYMSLPLQHVVSNEGGPEPLVRRKALAQGTRTANRPTRRGRQKTPSRTPKGRQQRKRTGFAARIGHDRHH